MKTLEMRTDELRGMFASYNPNEMTEDERRELGRGMKFFGVLQPVVMNERTRRLVGGHQRVMAALEQEIETLPVWIVNVDEPTEKMMNLALNKHHGHPDPSRLAVLIQELDREGADLALSGYQPDEVQNIIALLEAESGTGKDRTTESDVTQVVISYTLIFDNEEQQAVFYRLLRWLKSAIAGETNAARLTTWIQQNPLLDYDPEKA